MNENVIKDYSAIRNYLRTFDTVENRMKVYLIASILLFYVGDLYTTYINLKIGNIETNAIFRNMGFTYIIFLKTVFIIAAVCMYLLYKDDKDKRLDLGIFFGAMSAMGFYTFYNNIGVFITTSGS